MFSTKVPLKPQPETHVETVEEFLARGGRIERIEHYPDPEGRVLLRGWRENPFRPPLGAGAAEVHRAMKAQA
jgi:hypothetical protein